MKPEVLIVDDDAKIRQTIVDLLDDRQIKCTVSDSAEAAITLLSRPNNISVVLLDIWMQGMQGTEALRIIKAKNPDLPVIMISGHANIELAVETTKDGAFDFLEKPFSSDRFYLILDHAIKFWELNQEKSSLKKQLLDNLPNIIGKSAAMKQVLETVKKVAAAGSRVIIFGENGTGKELIAKQLHLLSNRASMPMVEVNCAAIPPELIESELFGHEKGSFTGAIKKAIGKFEQADQGTIFLDEIGDMSLNAQAKVLRALEQQIIVPVGSNQQLHVDVRVISATNRDLTQMIKDNLFREDLYYRLSIIPITVPPLRNRREDIPLLVNYFLEQQNSSLKRKVEISDSAMKVLQNFSWPGNVRELRNLVERLVILTDKNIIEASDLPEFIQKTSDQPRTKSTNLKEARDEFEKEHITNALKQNNWNISATARKIKVERSYLHKKLNKLDIKTADEE